ncbi:MAG: DUF4840 domain-containing protein [Prevotella sp.]|nr:DUF4840 domain-containing protein [Prevotella sp.]MCI1473717.1 DUF4840 domain-containing protein [Prevotella sp.]MCI1549015.1 DUF4840 domain-containing protein [Prevotella sp.]MCI1595078.1 DUF4840 domain-containing protein [Prevotella sp.]
MKKFKTTLFLMCGLVTALSFSSCIGNSNNDNDTVNLSSSVRANYYYQLTQTGGSFTGHIYRIYSNSYTAPDSIGVLSWNVNADMNDTTINIKLPVSKLARYITSDNDKAILSNAPDVPLTVQYRAPYTESQDLYNSRYYRFVNYLTSNTITTTSQNTPIEIDLNTMSQTGKDAQGNTIYFFSTNSPIVYYNGGFEEIIDIKSIKIGSGSNSNSYSLGDDGAHFEIIYSPSK